MNPKASPARSTRRPALGSDPFNPANAYLDSPVSSPASGSDEGPRAEPRPDPARPRKLRGTFQLDETVLQTARNTVVALSGPPIRLTLAALVEQALLKEIRILEKKHNDSQPFPRVTAPLRQGRPIGS